LTSIFGLKNLSLLATVLDLLIAELDLLPGVLALRATVVPREATVVPRSKAISAEVSASMAISAAIPTIAIQVVGVWSIVVRMGIQFVKDVLSIWQVVVNEKTSGPVLAQIRVRSYVGVVDFNVRLFLHRINHQGEDVVNGDLVNMVILRVVVIFVVVIMVVVIVVIVIVMVVVIIMMVVLTVLLAMSVLLAAFVLSPATSVAAVAMPVGRVIVPIAGTVKDGSKPMVKVAVAMPVAVEPEVRVRMVHSV